MADEERTEEGWEARMAARAAERAAQRGDPPPWHRLGRAAHLAEQKRIQMAEHPEWFSPTPPDDPSVCLNCSTWMIENSDLGRYTWWSTCDRVPCPCCHCDEAVIIA